MDECFAYREMRPRGTNGVGRVWRELRGWWVGLRVVVDWLGEGGV